MITSIENWLKRVLRGEVSTSELVKMGLKVGKNLNRQGSVKIDFSHCWLISIGNDVTLAAGVHILAHDASTHYYTGYTKIGLVEIGDRVFVGAHSIILPNVKIGNDVIIGAGSVVTKDIPDNSVAVGNPARVIAKTHEYVEKNQTLLEKAPKFDASWTIRENIILEQKKKMIAELKSGIGYVE